MELKPAALLELLQSSLNPSNTSATIWVAYSGGVDSHVLLHLLATLRTELAPARLHALHVDHQMQSESAAWSRHCRRVAEALNIPFTLLQVDARAASGESPEAAARNARYRALSDLVGEGDLLLAAHHQDDQAETLLLQLLRGAGPKGLAAMPIATPFAAGHIVRPLLSFGRDQLVSYAERHGLSWIDDPSNGETSFDRNYLRHEIMPQLKSRWPAAARTLSRSAHHCAEAADLLDGLAADDLRSSAVGGELDLQRLAELEPARQANLLRHWLLSCGLPLPDSRRLAEVQQQMLSAREDAMPVVSWHDGEVRRYRNLIYAMQPLASVAVTERLTLQLNSSVALPFGLGCCQLEPSSEGGLSQQHCQQGDCHIALRRGGERFTLAGAGHSMTLKQLFQQQGVPPWLRERLPLLYIDDQLAAIGERWVCEPFQAVVGEAAVKVVWNGPFSLRN